MMDTNMIDLSVQLVRVSTVEIVSQRSHQSIDQYQIRMGSITSTQKQRLKHWNFTRNIITVMTRTYARTARA